MLWRIGKGLKWDHNVYINMVAVTNFQSHDHFG